MMGEIIGRPALVGIDHDGAVGRSGTHRADA